jgi:hypothetical protein
VVNHEHNLGGVGVFNLILKPVAEPFFSILEDDNWRDPDFLETMVRTVERHPTVQIAWANMRKWQERDDGGWLNTGHTIWEIPPTLPGPERVRLFQWPDPQQRTWAPHSQGAMLARGNAAYPPVPPTVTLAAIEPFRERTFRHPLLLVERPLANFALTRATARSDGHAAWMHALRLLGGSYLSVVPTTDEGLISIWREAAAGLRSTHIWFFAALHFPRCRRRLRFATARDWLWTIAYCAPHPVRAVGTWRLLRKEKAQETFLLQHTEERQKESQKRLAAPA